VAVRLLFDESLARRVQALADVYPGSEHVEDVLGRAASDETIWTHAMELGFLIVTIASGAALPPRSSGFVWETARRIR